MRSAPLSARECLAELQAWEATAEAFPFDAIMAYLRGVGKHFMAPDVIFSIKRARVRLGSTGKGAESDLASRFLDIVLDKSFGNYDYGTYLGLDLFDLTSGADGSTACLERSSWLGLILSDLWRFETAAAAGSPWLPSMRPSAELAEKRMRLLAAAMSDLVPAAAERRPEEVVDHLLGSGDMDTLRILDLTVQPVYTLHDEYLFLRILQSFEITFAAMAAQIRDAIAAVAEGRGSEAAAHVSLCDDLLRSARGLFSVLATMQPESFQVFRTYTVGASAIQSERYKVFEALCARPTVDRMESPAFEAVPSVRDRLGADWTDLTSVVDAAVNDRRIEAAELAAIQAAASRLEARHQRWKHTHWRLAVRMIGKETGTGYTIGAPYLEKVLGNRLFGRLSASAAGEPR